jgi:dTDP-4-amino-4,6-dideoxygalactose transaminase
MDGIQGAILEVKMRRIEAWTEARRRLAARYLDVLAGIPGVELLPEQPHCRHVWHVFGVRVPAEQRGRIIESLSAVGIGTNLHYPVPVHLQPCFSDLGYRKGDFPIAEDHAERQLSLPIFPEMTEAQVDEVAAALRRACS